MFLMYCFGSNTDDSHLHGDYEKGDHQDECHPFFQEEADHQQQDAHHGRRHGIGNKKCKVGLQVVTDFGHIQRAGGGVEPVFPHQHRVKLLFDAGHNGISSPVVGTRLEVGEKVPPCKECQCRQQRLGEQVSIVEPRSCEFRQIPAEGRKAPRAEQGEQRGNGIGTPRRCHSFAEPSGGTLLFCTHRLPVIFNFP